MIDIHCHILHGLDDGPSTIEESVAMCRIAAQDGISTIVATPHFKPGSIEHDPRIVHEKIGELTALLSEQRIPVRIVPGADVSVTPELKQHLAAFDYISINRTGKYFLAEFPHDLAPPQWDTFLLSFLRHGVTPILTHPERNRWFLGHRDALYPFVRRGGMLQITALSLTGKFGREVKDFCEFLLVHDLVHVLATDAHSLDERPPVLSAAVGIAQGIIGAERADALVTTTPEAILAGRKAALPQPVLHLERQQRKSWMQKLASIFSP